MPALTGIYNGMLYTRDNNSLLSWVFFCPKSRKGGIKNAITSHTGRYSKESEETSMEVKRTRELNQSNMEQAETISMEFTEEELTTLNDGILPLIEKTGQARALVPDTEAHMTLHVYCTKLQALKRKICRCM